MIDFGQVHISIGDNSISLNDFVEHPEKHSWLISFEFPQDEYRDAYATPTGKKYGSSYSFESIYNLLRDDFIGAYFNGDYFYSDVKEKGDQMLQAINDFIGIEITHLSSVEGDIYAFDSKIEVNRTRRDNALTRLSSLEEEIEGIQKEIDDISEYIPLTKKGLFDKRTRAYKEYNHKEQELYDYYEKLNYYEKRAETERKRFVNSVERKRIALYNLSALRSGTIREIQNRCENMAEDFAYLVKRDIINKATLGVLPNQNLPLADETIRKRIYAGIESPYRYWATEQLVNSIIITCTLI